MTIHKTLMLIVMGFVPLPVYSVENANTQQQDNTNKVAVMAHVATTLTAEEKYKTAGKKQEPQTVMYYDTPCRGGVTYIPAYNTQDTNQYSALDDVWYP